MARPFERIMWMGGAALLTVLTGCTLPRRTQIQQRETPSDAVREELRTALKGFDDLFQQTVQQAADQIEKDAQSRAQQKAAVLWKVRMIDRCRETTGNDNPVAGLMDTWSLCLRMADYLETGSGQALFGQNQPTATAAARKLLRRIEQIGSQYILPDRLPKMKQEVAQHARKNPIRGEFADESTQGLSHIPASRDMLNWLVNVPLAPLKLTRTPDALRDLTRVGDRFTEIVNDLPANSRWQLQLLALKLEEMDSVRSALASFAKLAESSASLSRTADRLPARVREETEAFLASAEKSQPKLQATLADARQTADSVDDALKRAGSVAATVEQAGRAWEATANAVTTAARELAALKGRSDAGPTAGKSEPQGEFDINDYTRTAEALRAATTELRGLMSDVRGLLASGELAEQLDTVQARADQAVQAAAGQGRAITDHAAWRGAQLIALFFALAVVYRTITLLVQNRYNA